MKFATSVRIGRPPTPMDAKARDDLAYLGAIWNTVPLLFEPPSVVTP